MRNRSGFTLAEVAIAAVIMAILASVTAPSLVNFMDRQRAQTTADKLATIGAGIAAFEQAVHTSGSQTTNTYPGRISDLTNQITTAESNSCGGRFNSTAVGQWTTSGPFLTFYIPVGGLNSPLGMIQDSLARTPSTALPGTLAIRLTGIDAGDAANLDAVVDGGDGGSSGTVLYSITGTTASVSYLVPVVGKC